MAVNVGDPKRKPNAGKMGNTGGKYSAKSGDLSKAQLKRAGGLKASKKPTIDYTQTSRKIGSGVTRDSSGKLLTGSVKLSNGQIGVYKAGKRVINVKRSGGGNNTGGGNPTLPTKPTSPGMNLTADQRAKLGALAKSKSTTGSSAVSQRASTATSRARTKAAMKRNNTKSATFAAPRPNPNRPSFAKQEAVVAKALIDFKNATTEATKASAKRKYDQHVSILNSIRDYFRNE